MFFFWTVVVHLSLEPFLFVLLRDVHPGLKGHKQKVDEYLGWLGQLLTVAERRSVMQIANRFFSRWLISMLTLCQAWTYFKWFMPKCVLFFIGMVQRACYFMGPLFYAYFPNQRYNKSGRGSMAYGAIIATWMGNTSSQFMQQMKGRPKLTLMFYIIEEAKEL